MNNVQTDSTEGIRHAGGCFLWVHSSGEIVGVRELRHDHADRETWLCEYLGQYLRVQRLYPENGEPRRLAIPAASAQEIAMKRARYLAGLMQSANHEAGHATTVLCDTADERKLHDVGVQGRTEREPLQAA